MTKLHDPRPTDSQIRKFIKKQTSKQINGPIIRPMKNAFHSPRGYLPWNEHLGRIATATLIADMQAGGDMNAFFEKALKEQEVSKESALICLCSLTLKAPARYLSFNLFEVLSQTEPPESIDIPQTPIPGFHLFLPRGCVRTPENESIDVITIVDNEMLHKTLNLYLGPELRKPENEVEFKPGFRALCFTETGIGYMCGSLYQHNEDYERTISDYFKNDPQTVGEFTGKLRGLAFNTVMAMIAEPELIEVGELPPGIAVSRGFGSDEPRSGPAAPVWIGRNYRRPVKQEVIAGDGVGRSVRPHWRRGHWKHVCCGPGRSKRRVAWIKPVYVNAL